MYRCKICHQTIESNDLLTHAVQEHDNEEAKELIKHMEELRKKANLVTLEVDDMLDAENTKSKVDLI